jgi:hypothetical protein
MRRPSVQLLFETVYRPDTRRANRARHTHTSAFASSCERSLFAVDCNRNWNVSSNSNILPTSAVLLTSLMVRNRGGQTDWLNELNRSCVEFQTASRLCFLSLRQQCIKYVRCILLLKDKTILKITSSECGTLQFSSQVPTFRWKRYFRLQDKRVSWESKSESRWDRRPFRPSWCQFYLLLLLVVLFMCDAHSEERTSLPFVRVTISSNKSTVSLYTVFSESGKRWTGTGAVGEPIGEDCFVSILAKAVEGKGISNVGENKVGKTANVRHCQTTQRHIREDH